MTKKIYLIIAVGFFVSLISGCKKNYSIIDQAIPNSKNCGTTIQLKSGTGKRDFHITYEDNGGYYRYFNGIEWETPIKITDDMPYRFGIRLTIDKNNTPHFAWGANHLVQYCKIENGHLSKVETVSKIDFMFVDILARKSGDILVVTDKPQQVEGQPNENIGPLVVYTKGKDSIWENHILPPTAGTHNYFMPSIVELENGDVVVASRSKDLHISGMARHPYIQWRYSDGEWSLPMVIRGHFYEPNLYAQGNAFYNATWNVNHQTMIFNNFGLCLTSPFGAEVAGYLRGQKCGFTITSNGAFYVSNSSQWQENRENGTDNIREILPSHKFYYSVSMDQGKTWKISNVTEDQSGQGFGDIASNGDWVMMVWPDVREGLHLRYSLFRDGNN